MNTKEKLNKYILLTVLFAGLSAIFGVVLFALSDKLEIVKLDYNEKASLSYKVHLNENTYYSEEYLDEGMQYIASIIKDIEINYNYDIKYAEKVNSNVTNKIVADIKVVDMDNNQKVIFEKNEELKNDKQKKVDTDNIVVNETIKIDYQKYNNYVSTFEDRYGISADCKLIVTFTTSQKNSTDVIKDMKKNKTMTIEIPLSEQLINITKTASTNEKSSYITTTSRTASNILLFIISIILLSFTGLLILLTLFLISKKNKLISEYDKYINKLLRQYDSYITESSNVKELKSGVIYIKNFKELLDVRNNIEKAIIYNKVSDNESRFIITDGKQDYCYKVKREEFK